MYRRAHLLCLAMALCLIPALASAQVQVGFSQPTNNQMFVQGSTVNIMATALSSMNFLEYIKVYQGTTLLAQKIHPETDLVNYEFISTTFTVPMNATPGSTIQFRVEGAAYREAYYYQATVTIVVGAGDTAAPTYSGAAGIKSAIRGANNTTATITWNQATDNITTAANMKYEVYYDTVQANVFTAGVKKTVTGALTTDISGLAELTNYYVGVRAVDEANNREMNTNTLLLSRINAVPARTWSLYE